MGVNRFDDLCDKLDAAVFNGDWLFDAENRAIFEEYLRRWDTELRSHGAASERNSDCAALRARVARLEEALKTISTLYWHDAPAPEEMREIARRALEEK